MRYEIVESSKISSLSLRAKDYVFAPRNEADRVIKAWLKDSPGFTTPSTPAMRSLRGKIEAALREALEVKR